MSLLLKLLLAHLLGDFILQPGSWVKNKKQRQWTSPFLYLHTLIHFVLILLITGELRFWKIALIISISHFLIDGAKISITQKITKTQWPFFLDQLLHVLVLTVVAFYGKWHALINVIETLLNWKVITAYVFLSLPAGIIIKILLEGWSISEKENTSLPQAGKIIGIIERILVLTFILLDHWEAIGFLITAKSVFRFNDLKVANRKWTEYILIGTLLSFGIAILTGVFAH